MKIGIVGNQQEINISKEIIAFFSDWLFVNCYDTDENNNHSIDFDEKLYKSFLQSVDVVVIAASVKDKFNMGLKALRHSKHVYIEHPVHFKLAKLNQLIQLANEANTVLKFQQTFKHQSLFKYLRKLANNMHYISVTKNAQLVNKHDLAYIDQLLRTDLELMFDITRTNTRKITPYFLPISKNSTAILVNCRIEFENGTLGQIEFQPQHKFPHHHVRLYSHEELYDIDFITRQVKRVEYQTNKENIIPFSFEDDLLIRKSDLNVFNDLINKKKVSVPFEYESYKPIFAISHLMDAFVMA
ncbi:MAG: Gfo/Idh/MocA family oxidoreductase [Bacteroidetes bacterium]|jgi:hypothetical protein|nr:Gfo/Idh/MocA family oxidoreductase [Bacteroidota bacterium]